MNQWSRRPKYCSDHHRKSPADAQTGKMLELMFTSIWLSSGVGPSTRRSGETAGKLQRSCLLLEVAQNCFL
uniref:Uncharacterized protein n=1 Tax=Ascaris lumbricoides TaxID=6252 RepID=A0A0M3HTN1_ASCLU